MTDCCAIICGGPLSTLAGVERASYLIACDKGLQYALDAGVTPHLAVGDFDSYKGQIPADIPCLRLPTRKDETDTCHAVRYAIRKGYRAIALYCAMGGRPDHTMANLQCAAEAALAGAQVVLYGDTATVYVLHQRDLSMRVAPCQALSLLALSDQCHGVCLQGAEYNLTNATLCNTFPLGVSNAADGNVHISVAEGVLSVWLCNL